MGWTWAYPGRATASLLTAARVLVLRREDDPRALARDHRDVAVPGPLGLRVLGAQVRALGHRAQHDLLLGHGQRGAEAAADAAAERDPGVGPGRAAEEAL